MFMGVEASVQRGPTLEYDWPKHTIQLWSVELTATSGPSLGMARYR